MWKTVIVFCVYNIDFKVISILIILDSVLYSFGPFLLMLMTNFAIVLQFMTAKCKSTSTESTNQALAKSATRGTAMVVTVSITFILLTAPTAVYGALFVNRVADNPMYVVFMNFAQYLNHSINGLLYCIVGSRFRTKLLKLCCRKEKPDATYFSHSVNNTGAGLVTIS